MRHDDRQVRAQESQYAFPYHYIPALKGPRFTTIQHWSWGYRYLGGMHLALDQLQGTDISSLVDIGCGDGRFLREVAGRYPNMRLLGVDASERAVRLAQALNPDLEYRALDIVRDGVTERFEAATLVEVIEHIPPDMLSQFIRAVADTLVDNGRLVITVPHRNRPVIEKHYQHFDGEQLRSLLDPHFHDIRLIPFDVQPERAPMMWLISRVLGAKGKLFLLTNRRLLYVLYRRYIRKYLYARSETECERIAAVCTRRPRNG